MGSPRANRGSSQGCDGGRVRGRGQPAASCPAASADEGQEEGPRDHASRSASGVSPKDIVTFTRLFATMIDAGLPIVQCLDILQGQTDNKIFANVLRDVKSSVEQGATFSDSLRRHPKVFDHLYVNLVQAGEVGGILDTILNRLAVYIEKAMKLRRQVRGAMMYPSHRHRRLLRRALDPAHLRHPRLREDVQGLRRQGRAARAHADASWPCRGSSSATSSGSSSASSGLVVGARLRLPHAARQDDAIHKLMLRAARHRAGAAQDRGRPLHAHARDAARVRRPHPRRARDRREDRRQHGRRGGDHVRARIKISEGKNMAQPLHGDEGLPADGRADGRRRRADGRARHDAQQDRRLLRGRGRRRRVGA